MKILLVSVTIPLHVNGGFENVIWRLALKLHAQGHEVHFMTGRFAWNKRREQKPFIDGIQMHYVGFPYYRRQWVPIFFYCESSWVIRALQRQYHFDIIHSNQSAVFGYLRSTPASSRPPVVETVHGTQQTELLSHLTGSWKSIIRLIRFSSIYPIERYVFRHTDKIMSINRWVQSKVLSMERVPPQKLAIVHNSGNTSFYQTGAMHASEKQDGKKILYVGTVM